MAKAYMIDEINHLGGAPFWAEERHHSNIVKCYSGAFANALLVYSNCKTLGDFWKWQEQGNFLEIRYWDEEPSDEERAQTPWTPYIVHAYNNDGKEKTTHITEDEFAELQKKYKIYDIPSLVGEFSSYRETYKCDNPNMYILRTKV